jgi:hypothetical protein
VTTELPGTPTDDAARVLATGRSVVSAMYVSMSTRHPDGRDADYLRWHCFDHRPEQYRLADVRGSLRIVSTHACREVGAASDDRYDATDHVMTYLFAETAGLPGFIELGAALGAVGRIPELLPSVGRGVYDVRGVAAAPRVKVGADVLPWWPATGVYLLLERGDTAPSDLLDVDGVAGAWWGGAADVDAQFSNAEPGTQVAYLFLDDDPVVVAERLRPVLERRWNATGSQPLLAAPFHVVLAHDLTRHLPG